MSTYKNLTTVCAAVVLAFGLAACGGGDDDDTAMDDDPVVEMPAGPTQEELDAEKMRADEAEQALADAEDEALEAKNEGLFAAIMHEATDGTYEGGEAAMTFDLVKGAPVVKFGTALEQITMDTKAAKLADAVTKTDKEVARHTPFAEQFGEGTVTDGGSIEIGAAHERIAASGRFPSTGSVTYEPNAKTVPTAADNDIVALTGTLMGADGTYLCATGCIVTTTDNGYTFGGTWRFRPNVGAMVEIEDADYTYYGWWALQRADQTFRVGTFFGGTGDTGRLEAAGLADELTGTATFVGSATGKYAIDNRPTGDVLDAGHFEATATLTADFDTFGTDANAAKGSISGEITDFVTGEMERDWSVSLGTAGLTFATDSPHFSTADGTDGAPGTGEEMNTWTIGDVEGDPSGSWQGDLYHNNKARNDGTPARVVGDFSVSHGTVAHMIGAFGAANSHPDTPSE